MKLKSRNQILAQCRLTVNYRIFAWISKIAHVVVASSSNYVRPATNIDFRMSRAAFDYTISITCYNDVISSATKYYVITISRDYVFFQAEDGIRDLIVTGVQTC